LRKFERQSYKDTPGGTKSRRRRAESSTLVEAAAAQPRSNEADATRALFVAEEHALAPRFGGPRLLFHRNAIDIFQTERFPNRTILDTEGVARSHAGNDSVETTANAFRVASAADFQNEGTPKNFPKPLI
jgi:hypothetical protein